MRLELPDRFVRDGGIEFAAEVDERVAQAEHRAESQRVADDSVPVDLGPQDGDCVGGPEDVGRLTGAGAGETDPNELVGRGEHARPRLAEHELDRPLPEILDVALGPREVPGETPVED